MSAPQTIYLVNNGEEYDDYAVIGAFTTRQLADEFASAAKGKVEERPADVPKEAWTRYECSLFASKKEGRWEIRLFPWASHLIAEPISASARLGHCHEWDAPDPSTGEYTVGGASSRGRSEEECRALCEEAFWKLVAELDPQSQLTAPEA